MELASSMASKGGDQPLLVIRDTASRPYTLAFPVSQSLVDTAVELTKLAQALVSEMGVAVSTRSAMEGLIWRIVEFRATMQIYDDFFVSIENSESIPEVFTEMPPASVFHDGVLLQCGDDCWVSDKAQWRRIEWMG